jgi:hypothetical protein
LAHTDDEVLAHIHALKSAEPSFENRVGKHRRTLLDLYATTAAAAGPTNFDAENEGFARVVGKVSAQWDKGNWKPLLVLPGMNLLSREQRRAMQRRGPDEGQESSWLEGSAIMLDVLAIYR